MDPDGKLPGLAGRSSSADDLARIERYRAEARRARSVVDGIDAGEWTFHAAQGEGPMVNVTAERRAEQLRVAEMMEHLAEAWSRRL